MDWFKKLSLITKINVYGEMLYSLGITSGDTQEIKEEIKLMFDIIKEEIYKKEGEKNE